MNIDRRPTLGLGLVGLACIPVLAMAQASTQPTEPPAMTTSPADTGAVSGQARVGYLTGNNVYVRSGFHQNYYPVTKLNRGDKVKVLGEEFGWLKIVPPVGTYSLVEKGYVDKVDDKTGVTNDRIWVRAGSNLNDRRYAKQVQLAEGTKLKLLGETPDGAYYKIEPPPGAALWIKGDYVDRSGRQKPKLEPVEPGELDLDASTEPTTRPDETVAAPSEPEPQSPEAASPEQLSEHQMEINAIEAQIAAEATKPFDARSYEPILAKLNALAEKTEDETTQVYAKTRIEQIKGQTEVIAAVRELEQLKEKTVDEADRLAAQRARIKAQTAAPMDDTVVRGEVRVSGLYDGQAGRPQRWRIVAPKGSPQAGRTLAYVELPPDSSIDMVEYYGKYVGVRASGRQMLKGAIPPVPIYTIREIKLLDRGSPEQVPADPGTAMVPEPEKQKTATRPAAKSAPVSPSNQSESTATATQPG
jgi:uncharacterized protein YgiM (DUF1202 family)